ncbi:MAG: Phytanoyl-CoA dioxygenase [Paenibacillus sp.]|nr:Phytanoyl-CoA dioxygenase [Paenibacillus sp.]
MLTAAQVDEFDTNGFLKGGVILGDEEVERLREELDLVMDGKSVKRPVLNRNMRQSDSNLYDNMKMSVDERVVQIVNIWMASDLFYRHACHPVLCEEIAQLCRTDTVRIWHDQVQYKPPVSGGPTGWHQDHPLWPIIQPADLVSAWVALDDAVIENGCMWMVPGSHKWGNQMKYVAGTKEFKPYHKEPEGDRRALHARAYPVRTDFQPCYARVCRGWAGGPFVGDAFSRCLLVGFFMSTELDLRHL